MITHEQIHQYQQHGYTIAPGLFSGAEARFYLDHYMDGSKLELGVSAH